MTSTIPGFKVFLVGESGNGKTHVTRTLLGTGIQPFLLALEPGMRSLAPCDTPSCLVCKDTRDEPAIPWAYIPPCSDLDTLVTQARDINTKDLKALCNMPTGDRRKYNQYGQMLELLRDFKDSTGKSWGNVGTWNTDRCLVLDGLSSLNTMAVDMFVGRRPALDKPDYGIGQKAILSLVTLLTCQFHCHFVLIAHPERGQDEVGLSKITANALGRALAPELPRLFDDMPFADSQGTKFTWDTAAPGRVSKCRNLPLQSGMLPSYRPIVASWLKAGGRMEPTILQQNPPNPGASK